MPRASSQYGNVHIVHTPPAVKQGRTEWFRDDAVVRNNRRYNPERKWNSVRYTLIDEQFT
jgi:hypothetical protein